MLFLLIFVVATAFVALRRRAKRTGQENQRRTVLNALAPLVNGAVSKDEVLTGRYKEYAVTAEMGIGSPPGVTSGQSGSGANVLRVHITSPSLMTGQAWQFRNTRDATHLGGHWRFIEPGAEFPFGRLLSRGADIPKPDPGLEHGLRAGGIEAAFDRLPPSSAGWLPEIAFAGGMGRNLLERYERAGVTLPPEAQEKAAGVGGLRIEVERQHFDDPSPEIDLKTPRELWILLVAIVLLAAIMMARSV